MSSEMQVYYLSSQNNDGNCEKLGFKRLPEYDPTQRSWNYLRTLAEWGELSEGDSPLEDELGEHYYYSSLPFASLFSCFKAKGLKVTCLLIYCSEGDNTQDAFRLAEGACKLLGLSMDALQGIAEGTKAPPLSWMTVYGPPPDMSIF